jgi:type III secretion system low calcium response chaperone LcrH/SycD
MQRTNKGFDLILQHLGEFPNDRLCLKELDAAAASAIASLENLIDSDDDDELEQPQSLANDWKLSPETLATFYQIGVNLYEQEDLEDAICVFTYLSSIDSNNFSVWFSLGMCLQRAEQWLPAIDAYSMANTLDPTDPIPYLYSIDCFLARNEKPYAEKCLETVRALVTDENREATEPLLDHYQALADQHP